MQRNTANYIAALDPAGFLVFRTGGSNERMRIDAAGNVGIGTTPSFKFHVNAGANNSAARIETTTAFSLLSFDNAGAGAAPPSIGSNNDDFRVATAGSERMRIDSSGNLMVGTSVAPGNGSVVSGVALATSPANVGQIRLGKTASGTYTMLANYHSGVFAGGLNVSNTTTVLVGSSDERLKKNIVDAPAGNIEDIKVRSFDWKSTDEHQEYGVIAQELNEVAPYAVHHNSEEDHWGVDYAALVPMMIKEIQDLKAEVAALKGA